MFVLRSSEHEGNRDERKTVINLVTLEQQHMYRDYRLGSAWYAGAREAYDRRKIVEGRTFIRDPKVKSREGLRFNG